MPLPLPIPCRGFSPEESLNDYVQPITDEYVPKTVEQAIVDILHSGHQRIADYWGSPAVQASVALDLALEVYPELFTEPSV